MSEQNYRSISELTEALNERAQSMDAGKLPLQELETMLADVRELQDRMVILRFKAFEDVVKEEKRNVLKSTPPAAQPKTDTKSKRAVNPGFQLNFDNQAELTADEHIIPRNQVNLMDVIEKEEKAKEEQQLEEATVAEEVEEPTVSTEEPEIEEVAPEEPVEVDEPVAEEEEIEVAVNEDTPEQSEPAVEPAASTPEIELGQEGTESLADRLRKSPISDLKGAIGINQKYLLMNDLFEGDNVSYNEAIDRLNSFQSYKEAQTYLHDFLGDKFNWDWEDERVLDFIALVERRYL